MSDKIIPVRAEGAEPLAVREVMIHSGAHRFQHGRVIAENNTFSIPFTHVQLRGRGGAAHAN